MFLKRNHNLSIYLFVALFTTCFNSSLKANIKSVNWIDTNTTITSQEARDQFAFGLKFNYGLSLISFNEQKSKYFDNKTSLTNAFGIALYKWNLSVGWSFYNIESNEDIFLQDQLVNSNSKFYFSRNFINLGYSLDIFNRLSIEPRVGLTSISTRPPTDIEKNQFFRSSRSTGVEFGMSLYHYTLFNESMILGKGSPFFAWFLSFDQTVIDYSHIHTGFGKNSFTISLGAEFKLYLYRLKQRERDVFNN